MEVEKITREDFYVHNESHSDWRRHPNAWMDGTSTGKGGREREGKLNYFRAVWAIQCGSNVGAISKWCFLLGFFGGRVYAVALLVCQQGK